MPMVDKTSPRQTWLIALAAPLVAGISVFASSMMQELSLGFLLLMLALFAAAALYAMVYGLSLHAILPLIGLFFIKPLEYSFYFVLLLFVFVFLIEYLQKERVQLIIPHPLAFTLLLAFGILSATKIQVPMGYTYFISTVLVPIFLLTVFRNVPITRHSLRLWMQVISYIGAFVGLYGVVIALLNPFERLGSFWVTAMTINGFYTVAFFFAITLALYHKSRLKKLVNAACALLILLGMLYTYTRMAILAVAFGIFLLMLRLKVMRYLGLALMLLMPLLIPSSMSSRIQLGFTYDVSLVIRALAWYLAITQIIRFPLTGMGFSVWSTWYAKVIPLPMLYAQHTHNLFLNLMIDMGIIGTGAFLYLIFIPMHRYYRRFIKGSQDILSFGFWVSMMALLFACITDIFIQQYSISILFWVSLGLMISLNSSPQNEPLRKQL
ncbi:MAG: O-antigen ligase family protein [Candidatus Cloacimonadaceae bacterium]